ncbi:MAG: tetratricopeptide repeat protein [Flavobacteriales bacterium]|nr:tetratricopeptide repeat protein [Flavobacteriales bacterium]
MPIHFLRSIFLRCGLGLLACTLLCSVTKAQSDSLWKVWNTTTLPDSARLKAMESLSWKAVFDKPDSGIVLASMLLDLAQKSGSQRSIFKAHGTLAAGFKMKSDLATALDHYEQCLVIAKSLNDRGRMANTFSNMSTVYKDLGRSAQSARPASTKPAHR